MVLLDPNAPTTNLAGGAVTLSEETVHQQVAVDEITGDIYVTQVVQGGRTLQGELFPLSHAQRAARGDIAINRVSAAGDVLGVMYCRRFDHGGGLGLEWDYSGLSLWTAYDAAEVAEGSNAHGRKLARFAFQDGAVLDVGDPGIEVFDPFPGARAVLPALDGSMQRIAVNYAMPGLERRYRVWDLGAFKAGVFDQVLYDLPWEVQENFQSYCLYDQYIYQTHGRGYSEANPPPGDAFFAIIDITTGQVVRLADNRQQPGLDYREPESIAVMEDPGGPRLVIGFADGPVGARVMRLYATLADAGPGTWVSARVVDGEGVQLTLSVPDRSGLRSWAVIRRPDGSVLFEGTAGELPAGLVQLTDTGPPACIPLRYELHLDYTDRQQVVVSRQVEWIPPSGCGSGGGTVVDAPNTLGCAEEYKARIHWRGGAQVKPMEIMDRVIDVQWSRTLNDVSTATVTLSKGAFHCCDELTDVHDWVHELTIYRHTQDRAEIVWQGPIQKIRILRETVIIEAADVFAWLDKLVNTYWVRYVNSEPDPKGRRIGTIVYIAFNHLRLNMEESSLSVPPDYAEIMDYVVAREDGLPIIRVEKDGSDDTAIWADYLGDIFREWVKRGLTWTTVGRSLLLRGFPNQQTLPQARFSLDDLMGDIEVNRDGTATATYAFATTQESQDISQGRTVGWGHTGTAYGRLDVLVNVEDEGSTSTSETDAELTRVAQNAVAGRFPTPLVITVPSNAQVSPEAPVTVAQLVPGERFDVFGDDFCLSVAQGFALSDVEGRWENGREQISIGLVPLDDIREGGSMPPDEET